MTPGQQATQATHAAINFTFEHPARASPWFKESNTLVLLQVPDEYALKQLTWKAEDRGISFTAFREPDIGNLITAVALEPGEQTQKLVKNLKLLFHEIKSESSYHTCNQSEVVEQVPQTLL
jgi:peptidyl-tRNA hydrolase